MIRFLNKNIKSSFGRVFSNIGMESKILAKVEDYEQWLKDENIQYKRYDHERALNMEELRNNVKLENSPYIKNLFYKLKKGGFGILVALDETQVKKAFWKELNMSHNHVRMAGEEDLKSTLQCYKGSVNPLSLVNDKNKDVSVFVMDKKLKNSDYYAFHPGDNAHTLELKREDFEKLMAKIGRTAFYLDLEAEEQEAENEDKKKGEQGKDKGAQNEEESKLKISVEKEKNFSEWYSEVVIKGEMIEYYDISGCYILRPNSYFVWEQLQKYMDSRFAELSVKNTYFPMFVSQDKLETEKDHIEGFAPEVAWVTRSGNSDLAKPIAIRPTSETIMYPIFSKWIRSHRDLPLLINQWSNVVRWEFKHPTPFIRTREFLWQEGHTAHSTRDEADKFALQILDRYEDTYRNVLAVPVIKGRKSDNEKFAGGDWTYTCEGFISTNGRSIQACTSHMLGQNFAKMFDIKFQDDKMGHNYAWQTSWGYSTRSIGSLVMIHGDNTGLVMPPIVALVQVVIIPIFFKGKVDELKKKVDEIYSTLKNAGIRVEIDDREIYTPGFRFNHWELRGTPIRLEFGPKDFEKNEVKVVRRVDGVKKQLPLEGLVDSLKKEFTDIHETMYQNALSKLKGSQVKADNFTDFITHLNQKKMVLTPWCDCKDCEKKIKELSGMMSKKDDNDEQDQTGSAKSLCKPLVQEPVPEGTKCFAYEYCGNMAKTYCYFGRSY